MATIADLKVAIGAEVGEFDKAIKGIQSKMKETGERMTQMGKTMSVAITAPLTAMAAVSIKNFDAQVKAENKLRAALAANGQQVDATMRDYMAFASELQEISTVGDESTLELLSVAQSMGVTGEAAKTAAKEAIALGKAMGMSEQSAIRYTAALADGDANMLTRYLPALKGIKDESAKVAKAHELLGKMMGAVTAEAQDGLGPMIQLQNQFGDLLEEVGGIITEAIRPFIGHLRELVGWFQGLSPETKKVIVVIGSLLAALGPVLAMMGFFITTIAPAMATAFSVMFGPIGLVVMAIGALVAAIVIFQDEIMAAWAAAKVFATNLVNVFSKIPGIVVESIKAVPKAFMDMFSDVGKIMKAIFAGEFDKIPDLLKSAGKNLLKTNPLLTAGAKIGAELTKGVAETFRDNLPKEVEKAEPEIVETFTEQGKSAGEGFATGMLSAMTMRGIKDTKKLAQQISDAIGKGDGIEKITRKPIKINIEPQKTALQKFSDKVSKSMAVGLTRYALNETKVGQAFKGAGKVLSKMGPAIGKAIGKGLGAAKDLGVGIAQSFTSQMDHFGGTFDALMSGDYIGAIVSIFSEFASASKGFATLMGMVNNSMGVIFNKFMPVFDSLTFSMLPLIHVFTEAADIMSGVLMDGLTQLLPPVMDIIQTLRTLAPIMEQFLLAINTVAGQLMGMVAEMLADLVPVIADLLTGIISLIGPIMEVVSSILKALHPTIMAINDVLLSILLPVFKFIGAILSDVLAPIFTFIGEILSAVLVPILEILAELIGAVLTPILESIAISFKILEPILQMVAMSLMPLAPIFEAIHFSLLPIIYLFNWLGSVMQSFGAWIDNLIGGAGLSIPQMPALASGGIVTGPTTALIGEAGPEAVIPLSQLGGMMGGGGGDVRFRIEGSDLVGVLVNNNSASGRIL